MPAHFPNDGFRRAPGHPAFTLVELMVVMAMLTIVMSVAAPSLSRFFRGRNADSEAARFLALTRFGQSQAVEMGAPMILWVDSRDSAYGLREEYTRDTRERLPFAQGNMVRQDGDPQRPVFRLAADLKFEIPASTKFTNGLAIVRFLPDGYIDENSFQYLYIKDVKDAKGQEAQSIPICQSRNRMKYELADRNNPWWLAVR